MIFNTASSGRNPKAYFRTRLHAEPSACLHARQVCFVSGDTVIIPNRTIIFDTHPAGHTC